MINFSRFFILIMALTSGSVLADECKLAHGLSLFKNSDHYDITYRGRVVAAMSREELNDIYGGIDAHPAPTSCDHMVSTDEMFAMVVGHDNDLLVAFGIVQNENGKVTGLEKLHYYSHDGSMAMSNTSSNEIVITYGRLHDLKARFCWNPNEDYVWWHNHDHRKGADGCDGATWPWTYPNTGEKLLTFK